MPCHRPIQCLPHPQRAHPPRVPPPRPRVPFSPSLAGPAAGQLAPGVCRHPRRRLQGAGPRDARCGWPAGGRREHGGPQGLDEPAGLRRPAGERRSRARPIRERFSQRCSCSCRRRHHCCCCATDPCPAPLPACLHQSEAGFADLDADTRSAYLFNSTVAGIDQADAVLLVRVGKCREVLGSVGKCREVSGRAGDDGEEAWGWAGPGRQAARCECRLSATLRAATVPASTPPTSPSRGAHCCTPTQVGCNARLEAPVLNARLRAANLAGVPVAYVGAPADLTYPVEVLGEGADALDKLTKAGRCVGRWQQRCGGRVCTLHWCPVSALQRRRAAAAHLGCPCPLPSPARLQRVPEALQGRAAADGDCWRGRAAASGPRRRHAEGGPGAGFAGG